MAINPNAPHFVLAAAKRIYDQLPLLIGAEPWKSIQPQIDMYITQLEGKPNDYLASTQLFGLLAQYEPARKRLADEIKVQEIITANIGETMGQIAKELGINSDSIGGLIAVAYAHLKWEAIPESIPKEGESVNRSITIKNIDSAKSVKFRNMKLDLGDFSKIAAGFITAGVGVVTAPAIPLVMPLLVIAGMLSTLSALHEAMEVEIAGQEASVLLGMTQAIGTIRGAGLNTTTILKKTNEEREICGLEPLKQNQLNHSLSKLEQIKVVKKSGDVYYIIEDY